MKINQTEVQFFMKRKSRSAEQGRLQIIGEVRWEKEKKSQNSASLGSGWIATMSNLSEIAGKEASGADSDEAIIAREGLLSCLLCFENAVVHATMSNSLRTCATACSSVAYSSARMNQAYVIFFFTYRSLFANSVQ